LGVKFEPARLSVFPPTIVLGDAIRTADWLDVGQGFGVGLGGGGVGVGFGVAAGGDVGWGLEPPPEVGRAVGVEPGRGLDPGLGEVC
jgi:hypothetical protein